MLTQHHVFLSSLIVSVTASIALAAPVAHAADTPPAATKPAAEEAAPDAHLRGLVLMLRPEIGSVGSSSPLRAGPQVVQSTVPALLKGSSSPYGTSLGAGAQIGFRFHPIISGGLRADLGTVGASSSPGDSVTNLSRSWQSAGLYARAYPLALNESLRRHFDPWVSAGVTYVHDAQTFSRPTPTSTGSSVDGSWQLDSHSIGVPLAIGLDYRVTSWLAVGPSFEYVIMNPIAGCGKISAAGFPDSQLCSGSSNGSQALTMNTVGAWNAGITIRATPF